MADDQFVKLEEASDENDAAVAVTMMQHNLMACGGLDLSQVPVLELTIQHGGKCHTQGSEDKKVAVYRAPSSQENIVLHVEEKPSKISQERDEMILVEDGSNVVNLQKSMVDEYRHKKQYYGPLKAVVERVKVEWEGEQREILKTKLMQVRFVSKDTQGNDLKGEELLNSLSKIQGLIPPCDPPLASGREGDSKDEMVLISFGDGDDISISKKAIEQYRKLSGVTESLKAQREKIYSDEGSHRNPVTIVRLFPSEDNSAKSPMPFRETPVYSTHKPRRERPRARGGRRVRGRRKQQPRFLQDYTELPKCIKTRVKEEAECMDTGEDMQQSQSEDEGLSTFGCENGMIVQTSPTYSASLPDFKELDNCTEVSNNVMLPIQLQSAPGDLNAKLTSDEIWKYLTEYTSENDRVQGLITQFNNVSWLEVKRMSDFFHVDGEVMTDISIKAVYRNDSVPVTFFLRGFGRMMRTGELITASDVTHLFRCLSSDHKLCLGLKPSPYQPDIDNNEQVRLYFKSKGHFVSTPFESLFSKNCRGIVTIKGNPASSTFTRGSRTVMGVYALCSSCAVMGKKLNHLIKTYPRNRSTPKSAISYEKIILNKYNQQFLKQAIRSNGSSLSSSHIKQLFSQSVDEVLSNTPSTSFPNHLEDLKGATVPRIRRKKASKRIAEDSEDEDSRPSVGVTEEEFLQMIDLRPSNPGFLTRSLIKMCNVCHFRAPSMLSLFSHMKAHMGTLKEKCEECKVHLSSRESLETHKKQMHTQRSPMCTICQLDFTTKDQLFDHMNKHRDHLPFECPFCDHKLTNLDAYKKHIRFTHKIKSVRDLDFVCQTCSIHFYTSDHLLLHRVNQNHENEAFLCKSCGSSMITANEFRSHILEHTEEEREAANIAICHQCYKVFFSAFKLKFHMETKHTQCKKELDPLVVEPDNETPKKKKKGKGPYLRYLRASEKYECQECKRRFKTCDTLQNHIKYSHGEKKVAKADSECNLCGRKFNAPRRLANHMKIHAGNRPVFQCEECGQIYNKKVQVLEHIRADHAEQVQRHQQQQQQQHELLQSSQDVNPLGDLSDQPQPSIVEGSVSATWSPIKSPFKVPSVEQTQEAVYSLLQLTDF